ncbi:V1/V3 family capsid protein [Acidianus manzaensis]|uniref:Structural protein VP3 n=1 Tax=Acidianus manzaensis TaxID=282676 RepID=A0A1W6K1K6_9CREN|nr:V1/V3 family capsid protein [Acidianus manzaensis]ARM76389.1 structural protein VP3 [Acidianus manzaensis]
MEANIKEIIFLFLFVIIGIVLLSPIVSFIGNLTNPGTYTTYTTVSGTETETTSSFVPNPYYVGSNNAVLISLVPIFYILIIVAVPAILIYKMYKGE